MEHQLRKARLACMKSSFVVLLTLSLLLNLVLGVLILVGQSLRSFDASRWITQSEQVREWCKKLVAEHRPLSEAERFFGQQGNRFFWGTRADDVWTIQFETDDKSRIVIARIDGHDLSEPGN